MDEYTQKTKIWLDERFKKCDERGIYYAHQPIYGFRKGHCDPGYIYQYITTFQTMKALSHMKFESLLDVGAAEGQTAYIAKHIFNVRVRATDLSEESCLRAREIFHIDSDPADIHQLPYNDNEYDIVLCNSSLEHVKDYQKAVSELLRVASKAVVITLPHEDTTVIEKNVEDQIPHAHIHNFTLHSFDYLLTRNYEIIKKGICTSPLLFLDNLLEVKTGYHGVGKRRYIEILKAYFFAPLWKKIYCRKIASKMVDIDSLLSNFFNYYFMLFVLLEDKECYYKKERKQISPSRVMSFNVPYHYLKKE